MNQGKDNKQIKSSNVIIGIVYIIGLVVFISMVLFTLISAL